MKLTKEEKKRLKILKKLNIDSKELKKQKP
jgi:hypothetical protein